MPTLTETAAFERGIRPFLEIVLPDKTEAILTYRPDPGLQARIAELADKATEGQLSEAERAEYEGYVRANKLVAILKRQARHLATSRD
jgi:hypothetical protein